LLPIQRLFAAAFLLTLWLLAACQERPSPTTMPIATVPGTLATPTISAEFAPVIADTPTPEPVLATPTPPLAALVNDQAILLATYEKELARYEQAQIELAMTPGADYRATVLDALIEQTLIEQAAAELNITVTTAEVDQKLVELQALTGGPENFAGWLQANQWSEEEFRQALLAEMVTERLVNHVTAAVPYAVEQVRARYIQVDDPLLARSLLDQVRAGATFATLAQTHSLDRVTGPNGGDLNYFARGSLLVPEVETAAFALEVGQVSEVIPVTAVTGQTTYYLVQLLERDPQRPLTSGARHILLQETFESWLAELWTRARITRFIE
jgi:parvulin-like peptidyl-prolyl isomerase